MDKVYFWGYDGLIRHQTKSLMEAIGAAIENNVGTATDSDLDDHEQDTY